MTRIIAKGEAAKRRSLLRQVPCAENVLGHAADPQDNDFVAVDGKNDSMRGTLADPEQHLTEALHGKVFLWSKPESLRLSTQ